MNRINIQGDYFKDKHYSLSENYINVLEHVFLHNSNVTFLKKKK